MSSAREWTTVVKDGWGDGPWLLEPDKIQWVDEATGFDCLIVRHDSLGQLCGYVGVPPEHPCHGADYDRVAVPGDEYGPDVHGGLTYAGLCQEGADEATGICHVPAPGRPANVWWLGFDCAHSGDLAPGSRARSRDLGFPHDRGESYRTVEYVRRETASLAAQLVEATFRLRPTDEDS